MPDIKLLCPDGSYKTYTGVESITVDSATNEGERVKFSAIENPIKLLVEDVDYSIENASDLKETDDENIFIIQLN